MARRGSNGRGLAREILRTKTEPTDKETLQESRKKTAQAKRLTEARKIIRALEEELDAAVSRAGFLEDLKEQPDPKPYKIKVRRGQKKSGRAATYTMAASDWHVGERVRPETVGWRNEYTPEIAEERAEQFFDSNVTMLNAARSAWDIRQGIFWLGGDLMTGYIHEEYEESNFLSPSQESLLLFDMLNRGIQYLLDKSDLEHILIPTSHGNHGRTGKKFRISTAAYNSYEWLLYRFLEKYWAKEKRIEFRVADGYHNMVDVYDNFRIRFHHGQEVGWAGGIGGLSIPVNRRIGRQAKGDEKKVHLDVLGHFHSLQFPQHFMVNGSMIGWNAFAEGKSFGYEEPLQASFVVDERHGLVSNFNPILVKPHS